MFVAYSGGGSKTSIERLGLSSDLVDLLQNNWGIKELYPPQQRALPAALSGKNIMLTIPTASGKSLVAHLTIAHRLRNDLKGQKALYVVPLKALATEKYNELKEIADVVGLKVGLAIGDRSGENNSVENSDILVCTSEKLDSLLRNRAKLISKIGIIVSDEFHLLHDPRRGPTLEVLISRIRHKRPSAQIIALSATVGNGEDLAKWLDAELIYSEWRPVTLHSGTLTDLQVKVHRIDGQGGDEWPDPRVIEGTNGKSLQAALDDTIKEDGQLLVFVNSRVGAQKEARELSKHLLKRMKLDNEFQDDMKIEKLKKISESLKQREDASALGTKLADAIKGGVAFHHAGLSTEQRSKIEEMFKQGDLYCIVATPTLAQGVNLPARRVVIRDVKRWNTAAGRNMPMPIMEIRQMLGRAGRPKYDQKGDAWILSKNFDEELKYVEHFLLSEPEKITSKLANPNAHSAEEDPALLTHILSLIATSDMNDRNAIGRFFSKTFLSTHMEAEALENQIDRVIKWLVKNEMVIKEGESEEVRKRILSEKTTKLSKEDWNDDLPSWASFASEVEGVNIHIKKEEHVSEITHRKGPAIFGFKKASSYEVEEVEQPDTQAMVYSATPLGVRVSRLYLNPISGKIIKDGLTNAMRVLIGLDKQRQISPFSLLHLVTCTPDFIPLWPQKKDMGKIQDALFGHGRELLTNSVDLDDERRMKGVLVLQSWIEELSINDLEDEWNVQPGDLRSRVDLAEWLLYSTRTILMDDSELISMDKKSHRILFEAIDEMHRRVRYGCKSDLLALISLKGVGRVRAREMATLLGVSNLNDIASLTENDKIKLSELRGWSMKLVNNVVNNASQVAKRV
jgi:helicase